MHCLRQSARQRLQLGGIRCALQGDYLRMVDRELARLILRGLKACRLWIGAPAACTNLIKWNFRQVHARRHQALRLTEEAKAGSSQVSITRL
jgi:hypothetical protein